MYYITKNVGQSQNSIILSSKMAILKVIQQQRGRQQSFFLKAGVMWALLYEPTTRWTALF